MKAFRNCSAVLLAVSILFAAVPTALCSCKQEPETPDCWADNYSVYGNQAVDAINQISQMREKERPADWQAESWRFLKALKELPAPAEGLFPTTARDYGEGPAHVNVALEYLGNQHFEVSYLYPLATLRIADPESGETVDRHCGVRYSFYRMFTCQNRILQSVDEYYEYYYCGYRKGTYGEMNDGKLYVSDSSGDRLYFDLNPGIGVVEVERREADPVIPYETLLPLCRWNWIPINTADRENVTEHIGWW